MHTPNIKRILSNTSLFRMLDDEQLSEISVGTHPIRAASNTSIINQGDAPKGVYVLVYGQVKIGFDRKDGSEKTLAILGQNKCFGLCEMLLDRTHLAFVKTTADSMLLHTSREKVLDVAKDNFAFAQELMVCVGRQLYTLTRDIESYSLQSAKQRLAGYLLRQSQYQSAENIELIASKTLVASRLSLTPETLSRLLHDFSSEGVISVSGRKIKILDFEKLGALLSN
ncbi:Crp/Fnr family transcriptional regulator [Noviherbaspirillum sp. UKPF54]|uniref:Crp/Fnr family transcriptional regulator n=1 Tax=Noviherbaspirillum sp. UKPF54 TaxID=2601898 RepID=UPI0011B14868|nr:Crp/Fnr family transcriptional regulator [Noviherbaspirillum sp. UKPF54]QDZ27689.1 Crp/Fnr family transcriptional regulator [Noviherbaspirillum sp. UKPF54]